MSYILDALKKAERQRRRASNSELLLAGYSAPAQKKRPFWPYFLIAVLLINAGILLAVFGPWSIKGRFDTAKKEARKSAPVEIVKEHFDLSKPVVPLDSDSSKPGAGIEAKKSVSMPETAKPPVMPKAPALPPEPVKPDTQKGHERAKTAETRFRADTSKSARDNTQIATQSKNTATEEIAAGNRIYKFNELPQSVREGLPDLSLSLHFYNIDPSYRLINVKGKTLKEGEELSSGVKVEQITPEGAVFSYQNYRFQVGLNSK